MKVDGELFVSMGKVPERIAQLEAAGYHGAQSVETGHDPFLPLTLAAEHSRKIDLITAIAVAFARNPMNMASIGNDLNDYSQGRLILGIGSQIRAHIEKRFSMPWSHPAARMREMIQAMHAIWDNWHKGTPLNFRGQFYSHTLMTPVFTPTPSKYGAPRVFLAAVGPLMTEVAADVADGIMVHPMTSVKYLKQMTLPIVDASLKKRNLPRAKFELSYPVFVVSGQNEKEFEESKKTVKQRIAFYGSTPAYRGVLELHGWNGLQSQLNLMSKQGKWVEMGELIDDEMLDTFAVVGEPHEIVPMLKARYTGLVDRFSLSFPFVPAEKRPALIKELVS